MGESFISISIKGDSRFAENDVMGDSLIAVYIIGDSGLTKYGIMGDSIMAVSITGDFVFAFLPLYTKILYRRVSAPYWPASLQQQQAQQASLCLSDG
jgi:hypothetical protein